VRVTSTAGGARPAGRGAAVDRIGEPGHPFLATVGLRVDPAAPGSGVAFRLEIELGALPLAFLRAVEETVRATLRQGIYGWQVTDVVVTMTDSGYWPRQSHAHAHFDKTMSSTGADFRGLTPLVLMDALKQAGSGVYEPVQRFRLELPADSTTTSGYAATRCQAARDQITTPSIARSTCGTSVASPLALALWR
jgi:ribosomal protection tetracycline resistance protein